MPNTRYRATEARTRKELMHSLELHGARDVVLSTNVRLRQDGMPYAASSTRQPDDPGVAVYWTDRKRRSWVLACDQWARVGDNLRALYLSVEALRALDRAGASQVLERAYTGFAALPSGLVGPPPARPWEEVLGLQDQLLTRRLVEGAYRRLALVRHPDRGGTHEAMSELNRARDEALAALQRTW